MTTEIKFRDRTARVILVDSSGPVRQLLADTMKAVGFSNSQSVSSIADAHSILETEEADWLIVPLNPDQDPNGLHTVRMAVNFAELNGMKVSLLLDESESWVLPTAFEFGVFSYHFKPFTKDNLKKDFDDLLQVFSINDWNATLTSAEYLRRHLKTTKQNEDLLTLERSLLEFYPGRTDLLIHLAEAHQLNGATELAKSTLRQVEFIKPDSVADIKEKWIALFGEESANDSKLEAGGNVLGLKSVILVDSDDTVRSSLTEVFSEIGCPEIKDFADGDTAFNWINDNPEPSLIIMEWRIPKASGPVLIQRIRSKGYVSVPIIILSSLLKPVDMGLIREMGVANLALKPFERITILKTIIWTIQQDRLPTESQSMEIKIRACFTRRDIDGAEELLGLYLNHPDVSASHKAIMRAEYAFIKESYEESRDLAIDAIKQSGDSIFALNILGKSLMVLRQYESALKCFQKAQSISPSNIERLVTIAEAQAEAGNSEEAEVAIKRAQDIDPESIALKEGEVKVALASGQTIKATEIMSQLESMNNVIGYLNNKAVANSRCGFTSEGIEIYQKTLAAVPPKQKEIIAIVTYNMALARIRNGDLKDALLDLDAVLKLASARIHRKASDLKERLETSLSGDGSFDLREAQTTPKPGDNNPLQSTKTEAPPATASADTLINRILDLNRGDHCCYLLFKSTGISPPALAKLMAKEPNFKARRAIQRGETFAGAEGTKTAS
jgi:DNA-binding response OmpR family regulator